MSEGGGKARAKEPGTLVHYKASGSGHLSDKLKDLAMSEL